MRPIREFVINRRDLTVAATAAAIGATTGLPGAPSAGFAAESDQNKMPAFAPPKGAVDCHVHVFDPRFPFDESRSYTPRPASIVDLQALHSRLGIERTILVQPSVYGTDNRCLVDALSKLGPKVARGIAVIDATTVTDDELTALQSAGVVGVRVNLSTKGEGRAAAAVAAVSETAARVAPFDFVIQVYVEIPLVEALENTVAASPVPVVFDHFGGAKAELGVNQRGLDALRRLLASGKAWVKMSAPYRASGKSPDYPDVAPIARALIEANEDRLVWASDWPHTGGGAERRGRKATDIEPFRSIDDAHELALLSTWTKSSAVHKKILVDNAVSLFRF
ncbi:amidohydrolase family protein [Microbacteriaceae bacterium K1510]|nr:amidohydrolase family protein [Microbacteriaceae bacterium K1510]